MGYEALRSGAAARDLSGRGRILAHGEDNARLLHAMSSNHVQGLEEGQGCYAFFLTAQGRILSDATILRVGADLLIDCEGVAREALFAHLDKFIIADDVTLEDLQETHCEIGIEGPMAAERLLAMGVPVPEVQNGIVAFEGGYVARINETGLDGVRLILPMKMREEWLARFEAADEQAWDVVRHEQGKPKFGLEILAKHLVQEDVMLRVHPDVAKELKANNGRLLNEMEELTKRTIIVKSDPALHQEQFDIN